MLAHTPEKRPGASLSIILDMSDTTKQVELEAYLAEKGVKVVFKNLLKVSPLGPQCHTSLLHPLICQTICIRKPEDPLAFAIQYLKKAVRKFEYDSLLSLRGS